MRPMITYDQNGKNLARCADEDIDPDWFFEPVFETNAALICRDCPLVNTCLTYALTEEIVIGVWGGLTESQRKALLKKKGRMNNGKANK